VTELQKKNQKTRPKRPKKWGKPFKIKINKLQNPRPFSPTKWAKHLSLNSTG